jgi:hypothetical protein
MQVLWITIWLQILGGRTLKNKHNIYNQRKRGLILTIKWSQNLSMRGGVDYIQIWKTKADKSLEDTKITEKNRIVRVGPRVWQDCFLLYCSVMNFRLFMASLIW